MTRRTDSGRLTQVPASRPPITGGRPRPGRAPVIESLEDRVLMRKPVHAKMFGFIDRGAVPWQSVLALPSPLPTPTPTRTPPPSTSAPFPASVTFRTADPSPIVRAEAVGGAVNGKLYVFGGFNGEGSQDTTIPLQKRSDVFDPTAPAGKQWRRLKDMPFGFTHAEGLVVGNQIWFVGGYQGDHPGPGETKVLVYETTTDTWTNGPDLPEPRGAGASAVIGRTIYFTGGMDATRTKEEGTTWALNLDNLAAGWVRKADLPNPRNHVAGAALNGYFYVIGGQHGQEERQVSQAEVDRYNPVSDTWVTVASLPSPRSHISSSTLVYQGRILVIGGETANGQPRTTIYAYDPRTNQWSILGNLPDIRSTAVSGIVGNMLLVSTGNGPGPTTTTWVGTMT